MTSRQRTWGVFGLACVLLLLVGIIASAVRGVPVVGPPLARRALEAAPQPVRRALRRWTPALVEPGVDTGLDAFLATLPSARLRCVLPPEIPRDLVFISDPYDESGIVAWTLDGVVFASVFPGDGQIGMEAGSMEFRLDWTGAVDGGRDQPCRISEIVRFPRLTVRLIDGRGADRVEADGCWDVSPLDEEGTFTCFAERGPQTLDVDVMDGGLRAEGSASVLISGDTTVSIVLSKPRPWTDDELAAQQHHIEEMEGSADAIQALVAEPPPSMDAFGDTDLEANLSALPGQFTELDALANESRDRTDALRAELDEARRLRGLLDD